MYISSCNCYMYIYIYIYEPGPRIATQTSHLAAFGRHCLTACSVPHIFFMHSWHAFMLHFCYLWILYSKRSYAYLYHPIYIYIYSLNMLGCSIYLQMYIYIYTRIYAYINTHMRHVNIIPNIAQLVVYTYVQCRT